MKRGKYYAKDVFFFAWYPVKASGRWEWLCIIHDFKVSEDGLNYTTIYRERV